MSLDSGTFSGSQKLLTSRSQTSASFSSWMRFQLIASTWLSSLSFSVMCPLTSGSLFEVKRTTGGAVRPAVVPSIDLV